MRVLIDMNLSPRWVDFLRDGGIETLYWSTIGNATARDAEIMKYARQHDCIVLTHDLDFSAMLAANGAECLSVVQFVQRI